MKRLTERKKDWLREQEIDLKMERLIERKRDWWREREIDREKVRSVERKRGWLRDGEINREMERLLERKRDWQRKRDCWTDWEIVFGEIDRESLIGKTIGYTEFVNRVGEIGRHGEKRDWKIERDKETEGWIYRKRFSPFITGKNQLAQIFSTTCSLFMDFKSAYPLAISFFVFKR